MIRVLSIIGTRPEVIKMAPLVKKLRAYDDIEQIVMLSGQHRELVDRALLQFGIEADEDLDLMKPNQTLGELTGRSFLALQQRIDALEPDMVLAQGDTTTVMVAAVTCFYLNVAFGHVEAGLRTGDLQNPFPEEFNRIVAGRVAKLHFAPTSTSANALLRENVDAASIVVTGNTVIDNLAEYGKGLPLSKYQSSGGERLILMTCHRRENFGEPMRKSFLALKQVVQSHANVRLLYPVHPNPNVQKVATEVFGGVDRIRLIEPLDYFEFVAAMQAASIIVTDSGGVQEEAPWLAKPVLVVRDETERPEAVDAGVVKLVGTRGEKLLFALTELLENPAAYSRMATGVSPYGDGKASIRIVQRIRQHFRLPLREPLIRPFVATSAAGTRAAAAV